MFKKILCVALCLMMVVPLLAACKKQDAVSEIIDEASKSTRTLNVWLMAEPGMDAEQAANVAEAINKLTKAKFKTKLNIKFLPESEYYAAVDAAFTWEEENLSSLITVGKDAETGAKGKLNEYGMLELYYPEVPENQVDILFINSFEKYSEYIGKKRLAILDGQLQEHQELSYTVNPTLLTAARYNRQLYAIPNNHGAGYYTYLLADTELLEGYDSFRQGTTVYDTAFQNYLDYIYRTYNDPANKIYPLYSETGKVDLDFYHYWNFTLDEESGEAFADPETFSLFGDRYPGKTRLDNVNLLLDRDYMRTLATKTYYEHTDGYITTDETARAAVRVVKGGLAEKQAYEEEGYTVIQMEGPLLRNEDVYSSMFAVGARSVSMERSMEIIAYLNTDEEIRNLLQYGIRDVNYTLSTTRIDGLEYSYINFLPGNGYHMDVTKTGNEFLAYPVGIENARQWDADKQQNLDLAKYPCLGVHLDQTIYKLNKKNVLIMNAVSAAVKTYLDGLQTSAQVVSLYNTLSAFALGDAVDPEEQNTGLAECLLDLTGGVQYTFEGADIAVTVEDLAEALMAYENSERPTSRALQYAPYSLYRDWCVESGVSID